MVTARWWYLHKHQSIECLHSKESNVVYNMESLRVRHIKPHWLICNRVTWSMSEINVKHTHSLIIWMWCFLPCFDGSRKSFLGTGILILNFLSSTSLISMHCHIINVELRKFTLWFSVTVWNQINTILVDFFLMLAEQKKRRYYPTIVNKLVSIKTNDSTLYNVMEFINGRGSI